MKSLSERLGPVLADRLAVPLIAAPMFRLSGPELVIAVCRAGAIGAFATSTCRSPDELDDWLGHMRDALSEPDSGRHPAPVCANLIIRQARLEADLDVLVRNRVKMVITSVGSPAPVVAPLHAVGAKVFADVASIAHAEKAVAAGADGLVLLTAGAGGQTGWANPFAFARAVRSFFDGPMVLAGGVSDGHALWAARVLGFDLGYMGTRFLATPESRAADTYRRMLVESRLDDVMTTKAFTGLQTNMLVPSIIAAGLDPATLTDEVTPTEARELYGAGGTGPQRWTEVFSAGHSVSGIDEILPAAEIVRRTAIEYAAARKASAELE
ncbi:MAG: nitronate monooxygenase [Novosphingobium sp.]|nr:nitronate monooxygenase [Novosphingobium sp.]